MRSSLETGPELPRSHEPRARAIPVVRQLEWTDCGAAALAMVLGYHGKQVALERVRAAVNVARDGVTARAIIDAAGQLGLRGRGLKVSHDQLAELPRATILQWELAHCVVLDRVIGDKVRIVDPATGPRDVPFEEVSRCFTGVALELRPRAGFVRTERTRDQAAWSYLRELFAERSLFARVVVVSLIMRLFALVLPLVTGLLIDWVVPRSDLSMLWIVLGSVIGVVGVQAGCTVMRAQLLLALRTNLDAKITLDFLDHMVALPVGFFQRRSAGDLMMRVGSNATIRELTTSQGLAAAIDGLFIAVYAAVIFAVSTQLGALAFGFALVEMTIGFALRKRAPRYLAEEIDRQSRAQGHLVQVVAGMETLKCAGADAAAAERYANLYAEYLEASVQRGRFIAALEAFHASMSALAPVVVLAVGAYAVIGGTLSLGTMLAMSMLATQLFGPLEHLVLSLLQIISVRIYTERIDEVRQARPEQDPDVAHDAPVLAGQVSLRNVSLRHGDGPLVVDDVTLDIAPGSSVALVGASGSGKSSLLQLLAGLVTPTAGAVMYDGRPLGELDLRAVRQQLGIVPQHPYMFGATIRENIALAAPHASAERIQHAAAIAALDGDIARMPRGFDTQVPEGGASLSGGQRQRIALARAVLREPSVLLIDEATSALELATEARITANLARLRATRIIVTHRLSTLASVDQIVVMDQGRVVETGTHASLLARGGRYVHLVVPAGGAVPVNKEMRHAHVPAQPLAPSLAQPLVQPLGDGLHLGLRRLD